MTDILQYAEAMRHADPTVLAHAIQASGLHVGRLHDAFAVAEKLADPSSISARLRIADARSLDALRALSNGKDVPLETDPFPGLLAIPGQHPHALPGVLDELASLDAQTPATITPDTARVETAPAWLAVAVLQYLLNTAQTSEISAMGNGNPSAGVIHEIASIFDVEPPLVRLLAIVARRARLLQTVGDSLVPVHETATRWLETPRVEAWTMLAESTIDDCDRRLFTAITTALPHTELLFADIVTTAARNRPLAGSILTDTLHGWRERWNAIGVLAGDQFTSWGMSWLRDDIAGLRSADARAPQVQRHAYIQNHLEVMVPGVLAPDRARLLLSLSRPTRLAEAQTYQITEATIANGYRLGWNERSAETFFVELGEAPVVQPLGYILHDQQRRLGQPTGTGEPPLLTDHTAPQAEDDEPAPLRLARRTISELSDTSDRPHGLAIQWAIRTRTPLEVTIEVRPGDIRTLAIEPTGVTVDRVRGRDLSADVERTLPLRSIRQIRTRGRR